MHPNKRLVASGETGKSPSICIWDSVALKTVSVLVKEDSHTHGVGAVAFSQCGSRLLSGVFYFRWFDNSVIQIGKAVKFPLIFNHLN